MLSDGKKLGGIGRLNEKFINRIQNYYGLAIRQNTDSLINMRKAVATVLYHCSEAATPTHGTCSVIKILNGASIASLKRKVNCM